MVYKATSLPLALLLTSFLPPSLQLTLPQQHWLPSKRCTHSHMRLFVLAPPSASCFFPGCFHGWCPPSGSTILSCCRLIFMTLQSGMGCAPYILSILNYILHNDSLADSLLSCKATNLSIRIDVQIVDHAVTEVPWY